MIGHLVDAFAQGRADARAGRRRTFWPAQEWGPSRRNAYRAGHVEERRAMARERRLAQLEMDWSRQSPLAGSDRSGRLDEPSHIPGREEVERCVGGGFDSRPGLSGHKVSDGDR